MNFKEWILKQEDFNIGPAGVAGTGMPLKSKKKKRSEFIIMPRELEQDRHTADRIDPGS